MSGITRLEQMRRRADTHRYTAQEILACGCEPEIEHCSHCDGRRQANAKREKAIQFLRCRRDGGSGLPGESVGAD